MSFLDNRPPSEHGFVGREEEMGVLEQELLGKAAKSVWVSGLGGIGKTSLAMMFAEANRDSFPGGVFQLHASLLEDLRKTVTRAVEHSAGRFLVVVDDADGLPEHAIGPELAAIRNSFPDMRMIVTSRIKAPPSGVDRQLALGALSRSEMEELLRNRLGGLSLPEELYETFEGHPLALALVANMLKSGDLTPRELLARLSSFTCRWRQGRTSSSCCL